MPIQRVGKFLEFEDLGITPSLGIESAQLKRCVARIRRRNIRGAFGCPIFGFNEENLDFLGQLPALEQVWFWEIDLKDIDGLYALAGLRSFGIHEKRAAIDFSKLPALERVVWHPRKNDSGVEHLSRLRRLDLWRYKPKEKSYGELALPESLERLEINWSNPIQLKGFPELPNLKELQFHYCRNLVSIDGIAEFAPNLKKLIVTRCANLADYASVGDLSLDHLYINIKGEEVAKRRLGNGS